MTKINNKLGTTVLSTPPYAHQRFQMDGPTLPALPRLKFLYLVIFHRTQSFKVTSSFGDWEKTIPFLVKRASRPSFTFDIEKKNQYNKPRVIQSKIHYDDISFTFYDTTDDRLLTMLRDYLEFYYGDFKNSQRTDWRPDQVEELFNEAIGGWGLYNNSGRADSSYFFEGISMLQFAAGKYTHWEYIHPKIKSFKYDDSEYENTNKSQSGEMSLTYEGIVWRAHNKKIDNRIMSLIYEDDPSGWNEFVKSVNLTPSWVGLDDTTVNTSPIDKPLPPPQTSSFSLSGLPQVGGSIGIKPLTLLKNPKVSSLVSKVSSVSSTLSSFGSFSFGQSLFPKNTSGAIRSLNSISRTLRLTNLKTANAAADEILKVSNTVSSVSNGIRRDVSAARSVINTTSAAATTLQDSIQNAQNRFDIPASIGNLELSAINQKSNDIVQRAVRILPKEKPAVSQSFDSGLRGSSLVI